ncbi:MAG: hypothetical protein ACFCU1_00570 [Sumerlaeia bacterium]
MSKSVPKSHLRFLLGWGAVFCFGLLLYRFRYVLIDDPYITFQYARNVVEGNGLVFNPGERVEGYSNFLWLWISALVLFMGAKDPLFAVQGLSVVISFGVLLLMSVGLRGRWKDHDGRGLGDSPFGAVLLACSYPFAVWSWGGLETVQFAAVVFLCALFTARCVVRPGSYTPYTLGFLLLIGGLSRPEGPMVLVFPIAAGAIVFWRSKILSKNLMVPFIIFTIGYGFYLAFRIYYYGTIIPNTVTAKVGGSLFSSIRNGVGYFWEYAIGAPLLLFALAVVILIRAIIQTRATKNTSGLNESSLLIILCASFIMLQAVFIILVGGDWMPGMRFIVPLLPCLCFMAGRQLERFPRFVAIVLLGFFAITVPIEAHRERVFGYQSLEWLRRSAQNERTTISLQRVGEEIATLAKGNESIAVSEAGVIPYYSRLRTIDMLGLIDPEIGSLGGGLHENYSGSIVLDREPELILLIFREVSVPQEKGKLPVLELQAEFASDRAVLKEPRFAQHYTELRRWPRKIMDPGSLKVLPGYFVLYQRVAEPTQ